MYRCPQWEPFSRRHPGSSPRLQVEHYTGPGWVLRLYCTSSIPSKGSAAAWPAWSCSRVRADERGVRSRLVASLYTQALCEASSLDPVLPCQGNALPPIPTHLASFVVNHSSSSPSSTEFPGCFSVRLCRAPTGPPENSEHCSSCPSSLDASRMSSHHVVSESFPLFDRPQCSMPLSLSGTGGIESSSKNPAHGFEKYRAFFSPLLTPSDEVGKIVGWDLADPLSLDVAFCRGLQLCVDAGSWSPADVSLSIHLGRWLTCNLLRILHRCLDTIPWVLEAANHQDQIGRHESPCVRFANCAMRILLRIDGRSLCHRRQSNQGWLGVSSLSSPAVEVGHPAPQQWIWRYHCTQPNQLAHSQHRLVSSCLRFHLRILAFPGTIRLESTNHSKDQKFRWVRWSNITRFLPKTCRDCISSERKSYQEYSSVMYYTRWESGRETFWSQTLRNWKKRRIWIPCLETQCEGSVIAPKKVKLL